MASLNGVHAAPAGIPLKKDGTPRGVRNRGIQKPGQHVQRTNLRALRTQAGLSAVNLAKLAGIPVYVVYQIENGHLNPDNHRRNLAKCARAMNVLPGAMYPQSVETMPKCPGKALLALPAPTEPPAVPLEHRTKPGQVQKIGVALTYDGQIIGGASLNLDLKALTPLLKRMLREALTDD